MERGFARPGADLGADSSADFFFERRGIPPQIVQQDYPTIDPQIDKQVCPYPTHAWICGSVVPVQLMKVMARVQSTGEGRDRRD